MDDSRNLPGALSIGASVFHPTLDKEEIDARLAELSYSLDEVLELFQASLPDHRSCSTEAVLWACRCAVAGAKMAAATRRQLLDFISALGREVDALHRGWK